MSELIIKAAVKDAMSDHYVSADLSDALGKEVTELLVDSVQRVDANDRQMVQPRDL